MAGSRGRLGEAREVGGRTLPASRPVSAARQKSSLSAKARVRWRGVFHVVKVTSQKALLEVENVYLYNGFKGCEGDLHPTLSSPAIRLKQ